MTTNRWHILEARTAFILAWDDAGVEDELTSFARAHPPPAFRMDDAMRASRNYADALWRLGGRLGLDAAWFLEFCHDFVWGFLGGTPRRKYLHPLPPGFGRISMAFEPAASARPADPSARLPFHLSVNGFWLEDTKPRVRAMAERGLDAARDRLEGPLRLTLSCEVAGAPQRGGHHADSPAPGTIQAILHPERRRAVATIHEVFDQIWNGSIEPARRALGAPHRRRELDQAVRDGRAFVARALVRRDQKVARHAITSATIERIDALWPGNGYDRLDEETVKKALTNFAALLQSDVA